VSSALAEIPAPSLKCAGPSSPSFLRSSLIFGSVSFATYLLSLVKTVIVSRYFGTSAEMDAFTIAVLVPNLLGALIAGSASAGLVPALAVAERKGAQRRADTYRTSFVLFMAGCTVASVALAIFGKQLVHLVAPAFTGDRLAIADRLAPAITQEIRSGRCRSRHHYFAFSPGDNGLSLAWRRGPGVGLGSRTGGASACGVLPHVGRVFRRPMHSLA